MEGQPFNIQVFCRPNPFFRRQDDISDEQYENCLRIVDNQITVKDLEQDKTFTDIFKVCSPESTQADLYNKISSVICFADVLNGYNSTVIAYGQTGGGKVRPYLKHSFGWCFHA